ncbi:MAG: SEC-C metal-binding domain-containing protein [Acidobacteriota bacterium]|nr:SEC-C metal-binding domain-containing protein [Acidobacteriota bacterium]
MAKPGTDKRSGSKPRPPPKVNAGDYCPCGSGKKFKKCCLAVQSV